MVGQEDAPFSLLKVMFFFKFSGVFSSLSAILGPADFLYELVSLLAVGHPLCFHHNQVDRFQ